MYKIEDKNGVIDLEILDYLKNLPKIFSKSAKWNAGLIDGDQSMLFDDVESFIINN